MYVCMYVHTQTRAHARTHTHTYIHAPTASPDTHIHTHTHTQREREREREHILIDGTHSSTIWNTYSNSIAIYRTHSDIENTFSIIVGLFVYCNKNTDGAHT